MTEKEQVSLWNKAFSAFRCGMITREQLRQEIRKIDCLKLASMKV